MQIFFHSLKYYVVTCVNAVRIDDFNWSDANKGKTDGNSSLNWEIAADDKNPAMITRYWRNKCKSK